MACEYAGDNACLFYHKAELILVLDVKNCLGAPRETCKNVLVSVVADSECYLDRALVPVILLENVKTALKGTSTEDIKSACEKLTEVSYEVFGKMYQQTAQAEQAAGGANAQQPNAGGSQDDVIDADYEVVDDK